MTIYIVHSKSKVAIFDLLNFFSIFRRKLMKHFRMTLFKRAKPSTSENLTLFKRAKPSTSENFKVPHCDTFENNHEH